MEYICLIACIRLSARIKYCNWISTFIYLKTIILSKFSWFIRASYHLDMRIITHKISKIVHIKFIKPSAITCHKYYNRKCSFFLCNQCCKIIVILAVLNVSYRLPHSFHINNSNIICNLSKEIRSWKQNIFIISVSVCRLCISVRYREFQSVTFPAYNRFRYPYSCWYLSIKMCSFFRKIHIFCIIRKINWISRLCINISFCTLR